MLKKKILGISCMSDLGYCSKLDKNITNYLWGFLFWMNIGGFREFLKL